MAAIDFPNSPTSGDVFTVGSRSWKWNGTAWTSNNVTISATSPITYTDGDIAFAGINLNALTDTAVTDPATGQVLIYNGTGWVNTSTPTLAGKLTLSSSGIEFTDGTQTKVGIPSIVTISQKTSSYTLSSLNERDTIIEVGSTSGTTLTIPAEASVNYPVGTSLDIMQTGTGQVTIAGASGVTVNATPGLKLRSQWSSATLLKRGADSWVVFGDLTA